MSGLAGAPVVLREVYRDTSSPERALVALAAVRAEASGGSVPGFEVTALAPEPLDVELPDGVLHLSDTQDTMLTWTPSGLAGAAYSLRIATPFSHGGSSAMAIECDGPDTGEVVIAAELVAALPALTVPNCLGLTCVFAELHRFVATTVRVGEGLVELRVGQMRWFWPSH